MDIYSLTGSGGVGVQNECWPSWSAPRLFQLLMEACIPWLVSTSLLTSASAITRPSPLV